MCRSIGNNTWKFIRVFILSISILLPSVSSGQETDEENPKPDIQNNFAEVKLDNRILFYVTGTTSYPSTERAAAISRRIKHAASNYTIPADSVKIISEDGQLKIFAGNEFIMTIFAEDAKAEGANQKALALWIQHKTKTAIIAFRHERSAPELLKKSLYALAAAIVMTVILIVMLWLTGRLRTGLEKRIQEKVSNLENKSFRLIRSKQLWRGFRGFFKTLRVFIILFICVIFIQYILGLFPWTSHIAAYTLSLFVDPVIKIGMGFLRFLPSLAFLIVIFLVTRYLLRLLKLLFSGVQDGSIKISNFDPEWSMSTYRIMRVIIIVFAVVIAYPYIPGSETSAFKGISVFLGILFSLGSSSFISNIIAGYSMTYRGAFKKGDRIQVGDIIGFVEEQKLMITRLRSVKNEEIVIPNSTMLNSNIINYSAKVKDSGLILHTMVGIGYETPWRQVDAMLKVAADRTEGLLKDPPPFVLKKSLGDFAVNYEINVYCDDASLMNHYYNLLHQNILDVFNENNVQIMTPAYEGDPEQPKVVPAELWNTPLAKEK